MKIAITGHSGHIGAQLLSSVPAGFEFITLGRSNSDIYWKLGLLPDPSQLVDVDAIVHLAWATTNRKTNFHTNIGGTIQLANLANDLGCPFLFISSVGVNSESL
jgi:nucleoside-diphosphate-sugar epimerase